MIKDYNTNPTIVHKPSRKNEEARLGGLKSVISPPNKRKPFKYVETS